ncbi:Electron transport complex protein RnfG [gamma proteobacterium IMCC2047]|nr:Electron transport complex protein RnfG [gamma proteobacterium IMCC2047]
MLGQSIKQNAIGLSLFAIVTAGIIAVTQTLTAERIQDNIDAAKSKALFEILPEDTHDNVLLNDTVIITDPALIADEGEVEAFVARKDGEPLAVILPTIAPDGYTGKIHSIVGIFSDGRIAGVRVLQHRETPGLGDKVELKKSSWILNFNGKSLDNPSSQGWQVKKDGGEFDQFTGATITPRAVVKSVHAALEYFNENRDTLLTEKSDTATAETTD